MYLYKFPNLYVLALAVPRNDYLDEDIPDEDETDLPVRDLVSPSHSQPSHSPSFFQSPRTRVTPLLRNLRQARTFAR
jgi:hypothetical protein